MIVDVKHGIAILPFSQWWMDREEGLDAIWSRAIWLEIFRKVHRGV